jgi:hypothetical protein
MKRIKVESGPAVPSVVVPLDEESLQARHDAILDRLEELHPSILEAGDPPVLCDPKPAELHWDFVVKEAVSRLVSRMGIVPVVALPLCSLLRLVCRV